MAQLSLIRDINQARVLNLLRGQALSSRADVARTLNLTRSTVTHIVNSLLQQSLVIETGLQVLQRGTGRPGTGIQLNPNGAFFVGADVGVGTLKLIVINLEGQVLAQRNTRFESNDLPLTVLKGLADLVLVTLEDAGISRNKARGLGVALPATVDAGRLINAPQLKWRDVQVEHVLSDILSVPVIAENDANASALAQLYFGHDGAVRNLIYLSLGSGVGAGIVIDGRIYRGSFGAAGEAGYMRLAPTGPADAKGNVGSLEAFVGTPNLFQLFHAHGGQNEDLEDLLAEYEKGSSSAIEALNEWSRWLAQGIVTLFNVLNPERIVLGGQVSPLLPAVLPALRSTLLREQIPGSAAVSLDLSPFGVDDNAMGAATLAYHALFSVDGVST